MINMACSFCQKFHNGDELHDNTNNTNKFYLTCVEDHLRLWEHGGYRGHYKIEFCPVCGRNVKTNKVSQIRCGECKFSRPINRTKPLGKYFKDDCVVCKCKDVVGDEPMVYASTHYCSFGRSR